MDANDKRAYSHEEFMKVLELFREQHDFDHRVKFTLMTVLALHLIHRIDDACHFKADTIHGDAQFPFVLKCRTRWSKNVKKMQHCPEQIILAADDWRICTVLWLAIYQETWLKEHPDVKFMFTDNPDDEKGPSNINKRYASRVAKVCWGTKDFKSLKDETGDRAKKGIGTHSERKYASTAAKKRGAKRKQVEYRGRWVGEKGKSVCDRIYIDVEEPYTDAFVASLLCGDGGPIKYEFKRGYEMSDNWVMATAVPNISRRFRRDDSRMVRVLGMAYLWAVFDETAREFLPAVEVERIRHSYKQTHPNIEGNPVEKVKLAIVELDEEEVDIAEIRTDNEDVEMEEMQEAAVAVEARRTQVQRNTGQQLVTNEQLLQFMRQERRERKIFESAIRRKIGEIKPWAKEEFNKVITNQRRFGGTIHQAFARQDPGRQAMVRAQHGAVALQEQQERRQQQQAAAAPQQQVATTPRPQQQANQLAQQQTRQQQPTPVAVRYNPAPNAKLANGLRNLTEF